MTFTTSAGATIGLSAAAPATWDGTGYAALTYTTIGEVTDLGEIPDKIFELVTIQPVASRAQKKAKGGYNLGSQTIQYAIDPADAGQILANTASGNDTTYSVKIAHPSLGTIYARALVMGGPKNYGDVNSAAMKSLTLEYTGASNTVDGVVLVP